MIKVGECFDLNGFTLEVKEAYTHPQGEMMYKVEYIDTENKYTNERGFISETLLKKIPSFPF